MGVGGGSEKRPIQQLGWNSENGARLQGAAESAVGHEE